MSNIFKEMHSLHKPIDRNLFCQGWGVGWKIEQIVYGQEMQGIVW